MTLQQLLSHTSGVPSDNDAFNDLLKQSLSEDGNLDDLRYWLIQQWGKQSLAAKPGTTFAYANMNYVIVGAILERVGGKTWEELITERVFTPLALKSAGLGPQATLGRIDAPLGHEVINGKTKAFLAGPNGDNPLIIGPAGTAHMSVLDFASWAGWNAGQGKRGPPLVKPETLKKLHEPVIAMPDKKDAPPGTPFRAKYGLGWVESSVDWTPERFLFHAARTPGTLLRSGSSRSATSRWCS